MVPLHSFDSWSLRTERATRKPKSKCFLIAEGANTEYWYLEDLSVRLAKMNIPEQIELKPVKRTGNERNQSAPKRLLEQACNIRTDADGIHGFDETTDRIVVLFDVDAYKGNEEKYAADLERFEGIAEVAVTNPAFELFLLLHLDNAIDEVILPNEERILENGYVDDGHRRFVEKLASEHLNMNVKTNRRIGKLAECFEVAAKAEKSLNQNPATAIGQLTSNVAASITSIIREGMMPEDDCSIQSE